jgi:hypothetical protein
MKPTAKADKLALLAEAAGEDRADQLALLDGLTEQQKLIARLRMRGLSQKAIAQVIEVTPARVCQEVKAIREHYITKGGNLDQAALVGESLTLFEEVEQKAWEVFHQDESKKLRALDTVMNARERQIKLLMDLGILRRAATEHLHGVVVSPVLQALSKEKREAIVATIISTTPGEAPTPPEEDDDESYIHAITVEADKEDEDYDDN